MSTIHQIPHLVYPLCPGADDAAAAPARRGPAAGDQTHSHLHRHRRRYRS